MTLIAITLSLVVTAPQGAATLEGAELTIEDVAELQVDPSEARLDEAKDLLDRRRFVEAVGALHAILQDSPSADARDRATYLLAKALYRMELYHSSLEFFSRVLQTGPDGRYFDAALEWCLFIGRKIVDDAAVSETLVQYGSSDFPEPYRDEFLFRLARHHFDRALAENRAANLPVVQDDDDGMSFGGDLFGTGGGGGSSTSRSDDEGISIGGDLFGTGRSARASESNEDGGISLEGDLFGSGGGEPIVSEQGSLAAETHLAQAERYALRVDPESRYGARAKFIEALVLFERHRENDALERFKDVVRLSRPEAAHPDARLRELAFFQLARTHFGAQQPTFSSFYYDKVDRDSRLWLDALFEDSWAQFRLGKYEKALGNLLTLHAPFFEGQYFPESRILEAVIYYENCRYAEAKTILTRFLARYEPILEELQRIAKENSTTEDYVRVLDQLESDDFVNMKDDQAVILSRILAIALSDRDLEKNARALEEVREERERVDTLALAIPVATELKSILSEDVQTLTERAGKTVEQRLAEERENIKSLVQQAIRIDIETARSEQERIESRLRDVQSRPRELQKTFVEWADDEKLVWPFEGEYWRDELGTYELTLAQSCR